MCFDTFSIKIQVMNVFQCIQPAYANWINNEFNLSSVYNARKPIIHVHVHRGHIKITIRVYVCKRDRDRLTMRN